MLNTSKNGYLFLLLLLIAVLVGLFYRQLLSDDLINHPGNKRMLIEQERAPRGAVLASNLAVLAKSRKIGANYQRLYPEGSSFAHITGYFSLTKGAAGLEVTQSYWLGAKRPPSSFSEWLKRQAGESLPGDDLVLTVNPYLQKLAVSLLTGSRGAIVVLEPKTGAVLALASSPSFDPNLLMANKLNSLDKSFLVNRATSGLYPPGSTFKIITLAAALENQVASLATVYDGPAKLTVYGGKVTNFADQQYGKMSLEQAFAKSTNTIFAQVGLQLGTDKLLRQAQKFYLAKPLNFDLSTAVGSLPKAVDKLELAWTAVGQGKTLVTPLQMAMVAVAIANNGEVKQPFLVKEVKSYTGITLKKRYPTSLGQAVSTSTARLITSAMIKVVKQGTGKAAQLKDVVVAGKTGSAEVGAGLKPHAWFIGFAPAENPKVAVAVLLENAGLGGRVAAPKAGKILAAALSLLN